jgi:hypothetical protein
LIWNYIKSSITETLKTNRSVLCDKLKKNKIRYIRENWILKEAKIIKCYIKLYINFGIHGILRIEDFYLIFKKELFLSIFFPFAIKRVAKTVIRVIKEFIKVK